MYFPEMTIVSSAISIPPANRSHPARTRRGHFTTPAEVVASALHLLNSPEDWLQENREAIHERLELSFEQSRNGETYTPETGPSTPRRAPSKPPVSA